MIDLGEAGAIDLNVVPPRLRQDVWDTAQARRRWLAVVDALAPGPLRDRLRALGSRIDAGVVEMHAAAARVGEVERVVAALDPESAAAEYKSARRRAAGGTAPPEMEALEGRFRSVQRLLNLVADTEQQLKVIDARLTAAVAKAAELAFTADDDAIAAVGRDVDGLVEELDALRHAFDSMS